MSQETRWRVGIIGAGFVVRLAHVPDFQQIDGVEVAAIADVNRDRAAELAAEQNVPHVYADYRVMLAEQQPDIVVVATPNALHKEMAIAALENGAHVLCEKPLALTYADAADIVATAAAHGRVLTVGTHFRFAPSSLAVRRQVEAGFFGRIYAARSVLHRRAGIPGFGSWFTQHELAGGGSLLDIGVHALDRALYLMGFPKPVTVTGATFAEFGPRGLGLGGWGSDIAQPSGEQAQFDVDDLAWAMVRFADGSVLQLQAAWATHGPEQFFTELYGVHGGGRVEGNEDVVLYSDLNGEAVETILPALPPQQGWYRPLIENFVRHLDGDPSAEIVTPDQALIISQILDGIQRSATTGREVTLE